VQQKDLAVAMGRKMEIQRDNRKEIESGKKPG
jgi:hypothetical protein